MSTLSELKTRLDALGTLGTLTIGSMPASPDVMGTLYEYGGRVPEYRFGVTGIGWEKPAIQIKFRGAPHDYDGPFAKARIAWQNLASITPGTVGGSSAEYLFVRIQQSPFMLQKDQNERYHFVFNVYFDKEP